MEKHSSLFTVLFSLLLIELLSCPLNAQGLSLIPPSGIPDSGGSVMSDWRAISVLPPESETAPVGQTDSASVIDSLDLQMLELDLEKAEEEVGQTSFWWRVLPQIRVSASYGIGNLLFVDLSSMLPFVVPRDDYRLTLSLSLNDILDFSGHSQAILQRDRLQLEYQRRQLVLARSRCSLQQELCTSSEELRSLSAELSVLRELVHFNELRFEQGKIEYDVLARSKLEVINLQRNIKRLCNQKAQLFLRLH